MLCLFCDRGFEVVSLVPVTVAYLREGGEGVSNFFSMSCSFHLKMFKTRMHSSRMLTVRCSGRLLGGGVSAQGVCDQGVCVCPGALSASPGGTSARSPPPMNRITDRCKTLPCLNYVADGDNIFAVPPLGLVPLLGNPGSTTGLFFLVGVKKQIW